MEFEEVLVELNIGASELNAWIEQHWVLPVQSQESYYFDEADVARVRLIAELRSDMGVNDDAIPVVLRLLDQIYSLRRALSDLNDAILDLPEDVQDQLRERLGSQNEDDGDEPP
ncbi:chaperone modulator CbpM [Pelagibius sp.]|uniref:chaperone modulator CbpM n=1 Tax=Pelagibius sp. TaxID=1931238 RepID=UPI002637019D|nr:chaperone modulator CbpM [Pelagibius sp.]